MAISLTQVTDYLLAQSWQIAVFVLIIAIINYMLRNKNAHVRYLLWLIVLAKCFVPPFYDVPLAILPAKEKAEPVMISPSNAIELPETAAITPPGETILPVDFEVDDSIISESTPREITPVPVVEGTYTKLTINQWFGIGWLLGACSFLVFNLLRALRANLWLWRYRKPLPSELRRKIEKSFSASGVKNFPNVWLIEGFNQPFVWGLLRGSIYVPTNFLNINKQEHQKSVLGHELSHVLRFDAAVNILQTIAQAIFWFHPLIWWTNRKIRQEREKCCDEMAIAQLNALPRDYSTAILETLAARDKSIRPVPSLAVAGPVKNVEERIKTMLRPGKKFYKRPSVIAIVVLMLVAFFTIPIGCTLTSHSETAMELEGKPTKTLHQAAADGDIEQVKKLIVEGADINEKDENGETALHYAVRNSRIQVIKSLLAYGAICIRNNYYQNPLHAATLQGNIDVVKILLDSERCNVNMVTNLYETALHLAASGGYKDIAELLVSKGADVKVKDRSGQTALERAARGGYRELVEFFITEGADADEKDEDGWTPLARASREGHRDVVELLLAKGADIKGKSDEGWTPLHFAAIGGHKDVAELLLTKGADVNAKSNVDYTVLNGAAVNGYKDVVKLLIAKGADVNAIDSAGWTALHYACCYNHKETAEFLIAKGANINARDKEGNTPLAVAIGKGHARIVELLREHGAEEELSSGEIDTEPANPLHEAAAAGDIEQVKLLISEGVDIDARDNRGGTPLHNAAANGRMEVAELLIENGADVNAQHNAGGTPLILAARGGHKEMVELLIANGADVTIRNNAGRSPLYIAINRGHTEIVELLRQYGAEE